MGNEDFYQLSLPPGNALTIINRPIFNHFRQTYSNSRASGGKAKHDENMTSSEILKQDQNSLQNQKPNLGGDRINPARNKLYK